MKDTDVEFASLEARLRNGDRVNILLAHTLWRNLRLLHQTDHDSYRVFYTIACEELPESALPDHLRSFLLPNNALVRDTLHSLVISGAKLDGERIRLQSPFAADQQTRDALKTFDQSTTKAIGQLCDLRTAFNSGHMPNPFPN